MPFEKSVQTESKALKCRSSLRQNWKYKCPPEQYYNIRETSLEDVFTDQVCLRWLDWIFWGWYLPSLSINYVGMSKDMEKGYHNCII